MLALLWAATTACVSAQGIYAGEPAKGAYQLPGGFEPFVHLRTYYLEQENTSNVPAAAWAIGGWAGLRSPWWGDFFQLGLMGYTSQKLYGPEDKDGTKLLAPGQEQITTLGEAFAAVRFAGQTVTAYRQLINRPFINPQDTRMLPNTFEAYTLTGAVDQFAYTGGYVTKIKVRDSSSFRWMSNAAGGTGNQEGAIYAGGTWNFVKNGFARIDEVYSTDIANLFYTDVRYPIPLNEKTTLTLGAQYYPQSSVGSAQIGSFSTYGMGLQAGVAYGPLSGQIYYTQTGKGATTISPYGDHPSYLNIMVFSFNTAGERAVGIGGSVDFADIGAPGLKGSFIYASGRDLINSQTGASIGNQNETDVRLDYAFAKGTILEGLVATFRYAWTHQDGTLQNGHQLRAYLNYDVRF